MSRSYAEPNLRLVVRRPIPHPTAGTVTLPFLLVLVSCGGATQSEPSGTAPTGDPPTPAASETPLASGDGEPTAELDDAASLQVDVGRGADWPVELAGSLWVLVPDGDEPVVVRLDAETGTELARIPAGGQLCEAMTAAFDAVWVCGRGELQRIDPETDAVAAAIPFETAESFGRPAVTADAIWALGGNVTATSITRFDPATNEVVATYDLGHPATSVVAGLDALWVTSAVDGVLLRVDPASGEVTEALGDLSAPAQVATGANAVWVLLFGDDHAPASADQPELLRYDPASGTTELFDIGATPGTAGDLAVVDGAVFVHGTDPVLARLDPETGEVVWSLSQEGLGEGSIAVVGDDLWVTSVDLGRVWRVPTD